MIGSAADQKAEQIIEKAKDAHSDMVMSQPRLVRLQQVADSCSAIA